MLFHDVAKRKFVCELVRPGCSEPGDKIKLPKPPLQPSAFTTAYNGRIVYIIGGSELLLMSNNIGFLGTVYSVNQ